MPEVIPRMLVTLVGDIQKDEFARVKYGLFCEALKRTGAAVETLNANLQGVPRALNAIRVFHPCFSIWRERFWKNVPAFEARSHYISRYIQGYGSKWDIVLQIGVVFDSGRYQNNLPVAIYTDYTAHLSAKRPEAGRSPFSKLQRNRWIDYERDAYSRAIHIFTRSQFVRESVINDYGIPPEKVTVIGAGVNLIHLPKVDSFPNENPTILFIGKEFYRKGGDILLEAFAQVRKEVPLAQLRMMTNGSLPNHSELEGVEVIPPTWDRDVVMRLYREANLFVLPSRLETWGDVLLEAMAHGLPCVGVHSDAMEEIILDGKTGLLVPPQDKDALATALIRLLSDSRARVRMGLAGRQRVESTFTWDGVATQISDILKQSMRKEKMI